ncbi:MAG: ParB/RepB/Spo0J family partition protein, partial [Candidatus Paceibacterota bacterium]
IENLQREDLNPVDRARAFGQLASEFNLKHNEIGKRVGRSREYVSNTIRLLSLPQDILDAIATGKISEGHSRPILMLADRPEEQIVLFKEVMYKKLTVRETEGIARRIAYDRVRKKEYFQDPEIAALEEKFTERFGTRVRIEKKDQGGKMVVDFFSNEDLRGILDLMQATKARSGTELMDKFIQSQQNTPVIETPHVEVTVLEAVSDLEKERAEKENPGAATLEEALEEAVLAMNDKSPEELRKEEEEEEALYSIGNFSI